MGNTLLFSCVQSVVRFYSIPRNTFESDEGSDLEESEEESSEEEKD